MQGYTSKVQKVNEVIEKLYFVKGESEYEEICAMLDSIYLTADEKLDTNFRHEYSSISGKIRELNSEELEGAKIFPLDNLLLNISGVYDYALIKEKPYINNLFKLKDHIGLEAGRIALVEQLRWEINNGQESVKANLEQMQDFADAIGNQVHDSRNLIAELEKQEEENRNNLEATKENLEKLNVLSEEVKDKANKVQHESITVLGIFASIVLTFTGGMMFSTSVLENIGNASAYRIIIIALIIGLVLLNAVIALIMYIGKVVHLKEIKKTNTFWSENIYWIVANGIFVMLIVGTYFAWLGSTEKAVLDESNKFQMEMYHKNTVELQEETSQNIE